MRNLIASLLAAGAVAAIAAYGFAPESLRQTCVRHGWLKARAPVAPASALHADTAVADLTQEPTEDELNPVGPAAIRPHRSAAVRRTQ